MKNITNIIWLLFIIMINITKAQNYPQPNTSKTDANLNKFVGTWIWQNGNNSFTLILKKENALMPFPENYHEEHIIGFHKYVNNGVVIENFLTVSNTNFSDKKWTIFSSIDNSNSNILSGSIFHATKDKSVQFEIEYIDATHIKLLSLKNRPGLKVSAPGQPPFDWSITLPQNIILTKQ